MNDRLFLHQVHPFEDGAKLRIMNGNYSLPSNDGRYDIFHELIRGMLKVKSAVLTANALFMNDFECKG